MISPCMVFVLVLGASAYHGAPHKSVLNTNCYMDSKPWDHGAMINLNDGEYVQTFDESECAYKCFNHVGHEFEDCTYAVFKQVFFAKYATECYPRSGFYCSECDFDLGSEWMLLLPPSWSTSGCKGSVIEPPPSPPPSPRPSPPSPTDTPYKYVLNTNCYMSSEAWDHGAMLNLNDGKSVQTFDENECAHRCLNQDGPEFEGCAYAVFKQVAPVKYATECYPRSGFHCSKCDFDSGSEYELLLPLHWSTAGCQGSVIQPTLFKSNATGLPERKTELTLRFASGGNSAHLRGGHGKGNGTSFNGMAGNGTDRP